MEIAALIVGLAFTVVAFFVLFLVLAVLLKYASDIIVEAKGAREQADHRIQRAVTAARQDWARERAQYMEALRGPKHVPRDRYMPSPGEVEPEDTNLSVPDDPSLVMGDDPAGPHERGESDGNGLLSALPGER